MVRQWSLSLVLPNWGYCALKRLRYVATALPRTLILGIYSEFIREPYVALDYEIPDIKGYESLLVQTPNESMALSGICTF